MAFYDLNFKRNYEVLKSRSLCILLYKNRKWKIPHTVKDRRTLCFSSCKHHKTVLSWTSQKKKEGIFCTVYFVQVNFYFHFFLNVYCIEYAFRICILLHIKNHYFIRFLHVFKIEEIFKCTLKISFYVSV